MPEAWATIGCPARLRRYHSEKKAPTMTTTQILSARTPIWLTAETPHNALNEHWDSKTWLEWMNWGKLKTSNLKNLQTRNYQRFPGVNIQQIYIFFSFRVYVSNKILLVFEFDIGAVAGMNPKTFFSLLTISSSSFYATANKLWNISKKEMDVMRSTNLDAFRKFGFVNIPDSASTPAPHPSFI